MTEIKYQEHGDTIRLSVVGHALYKPGDDIVCAGVSTITCQLLNVLAVAEDQKFITDYVLDMNDGSVIVSFKPVPEFVDEWKTIWMVISIGYLQLQQEYPENVHVD